MKSRKTGRDKIFIAITIVLSLAVIALCVIGALRQERSYPETVLEKLYNGIPLLFVGVFAIAGIGCITLCISKYLSRKEYCTYVTEAVCVKLDRHYSSNVDGPGGSTVYSPIYEFDYNGVKHTIKSNHYTSMNLAPEVGSVEILHVDIDDDGPHDYYIGNPLKGLIPFVVTGLVFSIPTIIILIIAAVS